MALHFLAHACHHRPVASLSCLRLQICENESFPNNCPISPKKRAFSNQVSLSTRIYNSLWAGGRQKATANRSQNPPVIISGACTVQDFDVPSHPPPPFHLCSGTEARW